MLCPVCSQPQVIVEFDGIELDICLDDHGVWFDDQELRMLFETIEAPESLEQLESRLTVDNGADHGPRRLCPRCGIKMDHVRAPAETAPIILDRCPREHGIWFDSGELETVLAGHFGVDHPAIERIRNHLTDFEDPDERSDEADQSTTEEKDPHP